MEEVPLPLLAPEPLPLFAFELEPFFWVLPALDRGEAERCLFLIVARGLLERLRPLSRRADTRPVSLSTTKPEVDKARSSRLGARPLPEACSGDGDELVVTTAAAAASPSSLFFFLAGLAGFKLALAGTLAVGSRIGASSSSLSSD